MTAQTILITGCNSGFGRLASLTLAARGHTVYAGMRDPAGRNAAAAAELQAHGIHPIELDPCSDASVDAAVAAVLAQTGGNLDVAINNAGAGTLGLAEGYTTAQLADLFNLNVLGPQRINRAVLPAMRARRSGLLVHISSEIGRLVIPTMGPYCASKFALEALAENYAYELAPLGIDSIIIEPSGYPTNFLTGSWGPADPERAAGYGPLANLAEQIGGGIRAMLSAAGAPNPQDIADALTALVEAPAGQRPLRTVVSPNGGAATKAINATCTQAQTGLLQAIGLGFLAGKAGAAS